MYLIVCSSKGWAHIWAHPHDCGGLQVRAVILKTILFLNFIVFLYNTNVYSFFFFLQWLPTWCHISVHISVQFYLSVLYHSQWMNKPSSEANLCQAAHFFMVCHFFDLLQRDRGKLVAWPRSQKDEGQRPFYPLIIVYAVWSCFFWEFLGNLERICCSSKFHWSPFINVWVIFPRIRQMPAIAWPP